MNAGERVFINTLAASTRCVVSVVLLLLSARFVLAAIGVEDFGLYAVIAGIMGFMGFLNSAMAAGSQRHLAFSIGRGDASQVGSVFSACLGIHMGMVVLLVVLGETLGLWFLGHVLHIPEARRGAAGWVYQFTILTVVANVIVVPFQALLTAHEALLTISLLGIVQTLLYFSLALALGHLPGDLLIVYAMFVCIITLLLVAAQAVTALVRYPESRLGFRAVRDWRLVVEIAAFSVWNSFGALAGVARLQGIAFLLNIFFGTAVNAAYSIANQVGAQTSQFTQAMLQAVGPQVTKSEGAGDRERALSLALLANKYAFLMDCLWLVPLYVELPTVLHLWLKEVPPYTTEFCRMVLLLLAVEKLSAGFMTIVAAIGKIALYQVVMGGLLTCILPAGWIAFKMGCSPMSIFGIALAFSVAAALVRVWFVRRLTGMPYSRWFSAVIVRVLYGVLPALVVASVLNMVLKDGLLRLLCLTIVACPTVALGAFMLAMDAGERCRWVNLAKTLRYRVDRRYRLAACQTALGATPNHPAQSRPFK